MNRTEVINYLDDIRTNVVYKITSKEKETIRIAIEALEQLGQKKGNWIQTVAGYQCSNCFYKLRTTGLPRSCPNCFADMQ